MAGAGAFPAGLGPAGFDPVVVSSPVRALLPAAIRFEGSSRDWVLDDNRNYRAVTPNEQMVILAMSVKLGDLKSSPTVGNTLHQIQYLGGDNLGTDISNRVVSANPIAALRAAGKISIEKVIFEVNDGRLFVATYFKDLEVDRNKIFRSPPDGFHRI